MAPILFLLCELGTFGQASSALLEQCARMAGPPTLTVSGNADVNARPDKATVGLGVEGQADTATAAQGAENTTMQKVLAGIKKAGIQDSDIQTSGLSLSPLYAPEQPGQESEPPRVVGYRASNTIQIVVTDLQAVGKVIDAAMAGGANRLDGISFGLENDLKYRTQALELAAEEAKAKAGTLAEALGVKLVSVRNVNQVAMNIPRPLPLYAGMERAALAPTPVEPGQMKVEASVTVEYQIESVGAGAGAKKP